MIINNLKYLLFFWVLSISKNAFAQKNYYADDAKLNSNRGVLYAGLITKIEFEIDNIGVKKHKINRKDLEAFCKDYKIIDSLGEYYITVDKINLERKAIVKVRERKNQYQWIDSITFILKECPEVIGGFGFLGNGSYSNPAHDFYKPKLTLSSRCLYLKKNKGRVISYRIIFFDVKNLELFQRKIDENNDNEEFWLYFRKSKGFFKIEIDSILAVVEDDTFYIAPLNYKVMGDTLKNFVAEFYNNIDRKIILKDINEFNKDSIYGNSKNLKQIIGSDTIILAKRLDSLSKLVRFKRYYPEKVEKLKLDVKRVSDSSYYIKYYNDKGICVLEGRSLQSIFEIREGMTWYDGTGMTFSSSLDSLHCFMYEQKIMPFGEWKFYHGNGRLFAKGDFKPGNNKETSWSSNSHSLDFHHQYCYLLGNWKFFDISGKLQEERFFNKK